ncbi:MAG: type II CAAX endopeptidase family protein [Haloferacaceae archaeon]
MSRLPRWFGSVLRSADGSRPRATWRIALPILVAVAATVGTSALVSGLSIEGHATGIVQKALVAAVVAGFLWFAARRLDRRPVAEYGFRFSRDWWTDFLAGVVLGVLLVGVAFLLGRALGLVRVVGYFSAGDAGALLPWLALFGVGWVCTGFWEETIFRGLVLTNAAEGFASRGLSPRGALAAAVVVSSVLFGFLHAPFSTVPGDASLAGMLAVWTLMGGLLGVGYALSGELAFPIGLHFAFNYAANNVFFGFDLAGFPALPTVVRTELVGSGAAHPIGGLPMVGSILAGYVLLVGWYALRQGEVGLADGVSRRSRSSASDGQ